MFNISFGVVLIKLLICAILNKKLNFIDFVDCLILKQLESFNQKSSLQDLKKYIFLPFLMVNEDRKVT